MMLQIELNGGGREDEEQEGNFWLIGFWVDGILGRWGRITGSWVWDLGEVTCNFIIS